MATYLDVMNAVVRKQKEIMGKAAITIAKRVKELEIDNYGNVTSCKIPEEDEVLCKLIHEYEKITGEVALTISAKAIEPLVFPKLKAPYKIEIKIKKILIN